MWTPDGFDTGSFTPYIFKKDVDGSDRQGLEGLDEEFTKWQTCAIK